MKLLLALILIHSWYPVACCNGTDEGGDCAPVPCDQVSGPTSDPTYRGVHFAHILPSPNAQCHACVLHGKGLCIFLRQDS